jgi:hypothetical protein
MPLYDKSPAARLRRMGRLYSVLLPGLSTAASNWCSPARYQARLAELAAAGAVAQVVGQDGTRSNKLGGAAAGAASGTLLLPGVGTAIGALAGAANARRTPGEATVAIACGTDVRLTVMPGEAAHRFVAEFNAYVASAAQADGGPPAWPGDRPAHPR